MDSGKKIEHNTQSSFTNFSSVLQEVQLMKFRAGGLLSFYYIFKKSQIPDYLLSLNSNILSFPGPTSPVWFTTSDQKL